MSEGTHWVLVGTKCTHGLPRVLRKSQNVLAILIFVSVIGLWKGGSHFCAAQTKGIMNVIIPLVMSSYNDVNDDDKPKWVTMRMTMFKKMMTTMMML